MWTQMSRAFSVMGSHLVTQQLISKTDQLAHLVAFVPGFCGHHDEVAMHLLAEPLIDRGGDNLQAAKTRFTWVCPARC